MDASCTNREGSGPGPRRGAPELSIEVSPANISLVVGESVRVEATVTEFNATYPKYGKIHYSPPTSWDSSDPNVATVSGMEAHTAIVTAVSAGTTQIFARWMWGVGVLEITVRAKPSEP